MQQAIDAMERAGRISNANLEGWEDRILAAHRYITDVHAR
jgi:hypothetical protein